MKNELNWEEEKKLVEEVLRRDKQPMTSDEIRSLIKQGLVMRVDSSKMTDQIEDYLLNKCKGKIGWIEPRVEYWVFYNATYKLFADTYKDELWSNIPKNVNRSRLKKLIDSYIDV